MREEVGSGDADLLRTAVSHANPRVRTVGVAAVSKTTFGDEAAPTLTKLLEDDEQEVRLAAVRSLANIGDPASLAAAVDLLESSDLQVRVAGIRVLRGLTGKRFAFTAYGKPEDRAKAVKSWQEWVKTEGKTAKLTYPIRDSGVIFGKTPSTMTVPIAPKNRMAGKKMDQ